MTQPRRLAALIAAAGLICSLGIGLGGCADPGGRPTHSGAVVTIVPKPRSIALTSGPGFDVRAAESITLVGDGEAASRLRPAAAYLSELLARAAPAAPRIVTAPHAPPDGVAMLLDPTAPAEHYRLEASGSRLTITAGAEAGAFNAVATVRQLLPPQLEPERNTKGSSGPKATAIVPPITIEDRPRYPFRAMMLDVARSFFPPEDVARVIDTMSLYKLNILHLHLSDDQGWRIAVPRYPKLTEIGASYQAGGAAGGPWFYTSEQYREIVEYAASRGIEVIPELDGPGHVNAAQSAYGSLTCENRATEPYTGHDVGFSLYCLTREDRARDAEEFLRAAWAHVASLGDPPYLNFGGDEAATATPTSYARYVAAASDIAAKLGKPVMAWIQFGLHDLPPGTVLQYWGTATDNRSIGGAESESIFALREGLRQGAKVVMSPADRAYIDHKYDDSTDVGMQWAGHTMPRDSYEWDPATYVSAPSEDSIVPADSIVGVEATLFSDHLYREPIGEKPETFLTPMSYFGYMALPRLPALAEVAWSSQDARDWTDFRSRIAAHAQRWERLGLDYFRSPDIW